MIGRSVYPITPALVDFLNHNLLPLEESVFRYFQDLAEVVYAVDAAERSGAPGMRYAALSKLRDYNEDHNTTRFVVLTREFVTAPQGDGPVVTSFVFNVRNLPAALYKALGGFATNGVNMTKLESYMVGGEFTATPRSVSRLKNLLLESEVQAAITADDRIWDQDIAVAAQGGNVTLRGRVKDRKLRNLIVETVGAVKGVIRCDAHISLFSDPLRGGIFGHD